jgi:FkbM family methyltransferase
MKPQGYSILKSLLNSWNNNGFFETIWILFSLFLVRMNLKKKMRMKGIKSSFILRNHTSDIPVFRQVFMDYEYSFPVDATQIKTIVDAGANIGLASIYFSAVFPQAKIIAIEPDGKNFELAQRNCKEFTQVKILRAALWGEEKNLRATPATQGGEWAVTVSETGSNFDVKGITVNSLFSEYHLDTLDLLKIDIEGAEAEVFNSSAEVWLRRTKIIVIELHDYLNRNCSKNFFHALTRSGINFTMSMRGENIIVVNRDLYS